MTILEVRFPGGLVMGTREDIPTINPVDFLKLHLQESKIRKVLPGIEDITPPEFRDPAYLYVLTTNRDGTGAVEMKPRFPDSVMSEKPMSNDPIDWERSRIQFLRFGTIPIIIAGYATGDGRQVRLFGAYFWVQD